MEGVKLSRTPLMPGRTRRAATEVPANREEGRAFSENLVLFVCAFARERAKDLLAGLGDSIQTAALARAEEVLALPSPERQARLASQFGAGFETGQRLRTLMEEAGPALRQELFRRLPPYHRSLFPDFELRPPCAEVPPLLSALADRLLKEAIR